MNVNHVLTIVLYVPQTQIVINVLRGITLMGHNALCALLIVNHALQQSANHVKRDMNSMAGFVKPSQQALSE